MQQYPGRKANRIRSICQSCKWRNGRMIQQASEHLPLYWLSTVKFILPTGMPISWNQAIVSCTRDTFSR